jgi:hypothetical protein
VLIFLDDDGISASWYPKEYFVLKKARRQIISWVNLKCTHAHRIPLKSILILPSHTRLQLQNGSFNRHFPRFHLSLFNLINSVHYLNITHSQAHYIFKSLFTDTPRLRSFLTARNHRSQLRKTIAKMMYYISSSLHATRKARRILKCISSTLSVVVNILFAL